MRIGQGAQISQNIDYSPWSRSAASLANAIESGVNQVAGAAVDVIKDRKQKKDAIKTSAEMIDSAVKLFGDDLAPLAGVAEKLRDEEIPLSERAALGQQIGSLIDLGVGKIKNDQRMAIAERGMAINEARLGMAEEAQAFEMGQARDNLARQQQALMESEQVNALVAPELLRNVLDQTIALEKAGSPVGISSDALNEALLAANPAQQLAVANAAAAMLPTEEEISPMEIPATIDGQPGKVMATYNRRTGSFDVVPIDSGNAFTAPVTTYSLGADAGGPDEMQDKWTNKGFTATGKNLTPGVVAVNEKVHPLGTVLRDTATGEVFIAADKHGNKDPNVVDVYMPPDQYRPTKTNRQFEVIGREETVGKTPEAIQQQLDRYRNAASDSLLPPRGVIRPGAAQGGKTPAQAAKEEADAITAQANARKALKEEEDLAKADVAKAASANDTITLIDEIAKSPGFPAAVGFGLSKFLPEGVEKSVTRGSDKADTLAMIEQLKGKLFLETIPQMKGMGQLSDAEGQRIQAAAGRLNPDMTEAGFKKALEEIRTVIQRGLQNSSAEAVSEAQALDRQSATSELRKFQK